MEVCFMFILFVFFIPSIIGVRINNYFNKDLKFKNIIYNYTTLLFFSFIVNILIMYNVFGIKEDIFKVFDSDIILFMQMAIISFIVNVILVFIGLVIQKNVDFKIEVEKNEIKAKTVSDNSKKVSAKNIKDTKKARKTTSKTVKKDKDK